VFGPLLNVLMRNDGRRVLEPVTVAILSPFILRSGGTSSSSMILPFGQAIFFGLRGVQFGMKEGSFPTSKRK